MHSVDKDFVKNVYNVILGRSPDQDGLLNYENRLIKGVNKSRIVLEMATSSEAKFKGFKFKEIEDIIFFYSSNKSRMPGFMLDYLINKKYSDRINTYINKALLVDDKCIDVIGYTQSDNQESINSCDEYSKTRIAAQKVLDRIAGQRLRSRENSNLDNTLGIYVPRWAGVTASTKNLFKYTFAAPLSADEFPEQMSKDKRLAIADALSESDFDTIVFSGGDLFQYEIAMHVKQISPNKSIRVIWHGSPYQLGPSYELNPFLAWIKAAETGMCDKIGTVKPGMDVFLRKLNVPTGFIQNTIKTTLTELPPPCEDSTVGLWLSHISGHRKPSAPSLLALSLLKDVSLQGAGFGDDGTNLVRELGIKQKKIHKLTIKNNLVLEGMRSSRLTMYITLSECMPMVPFESISQGCPCLVGPAARVYDSAYLSERLVVSDPFDANEIRNKVIYALDNYDELRAISFDFLKRSNIRSEQTLRDFLN